MNSPDKISAPTWKEINFNVSASSMSMCNMYKYAFLGDKEKF